MASKVQICNFALINIGQRVISSLEDKTPAAALCEQFFEMARDAVLSAHPWNFATRFDYLAQIADDSVPGWDFLYMRPSNCLTVIKLFGDGTTDENGEVFEELTSNKSGHRAIGANTEQAQIKFTAKVEDPSVFSPLFVEALAYKLGAFLAHPLTGKIELGQAMEKAFLLKIDEAKRVNKSGSKISAQRSSSYEDAR